MEPIPTLTILALAALNLITIITTKNHLKFKARLFIEKKLRKRPVKIIHYYGSDRTMKEQAAVPDTENSTINVNNIDYQYDAKNVLYHPDYQTQGVVIREGTNSIIDTNEWKAGEIDPRLIAAAYKIQKERGRLEARQDFENYKKYFLYLGLGIVATIVLTFLILQNSERLIGITQAALQAAKPTIL